MSQSCSVSVCCGPVHSVHIVLCRGSWMDVANRTCLTSLFYRFSRPRPWALMGPTQLERGRTGRRVWKTSYNTSIIFFIMWWPQEPQPFPQFSTLNNGSIWRGRWMVIQSVTLFFSERPENVTLIQKKKERLTGLSSSRCEDKSVMAQVRAVWISELFMKSWHFNSEAASLSTSCCSASSPATAETGRATFWSWQAVISQASAQRASSYSY